MKKSFIAIAIAVVFIIIAAIWYAVQATPKIQSENTQQSSQSPKVSSASPEASPSTVAATPGKYINYSDTVIAETPGTKLLFFHAPWCPQCRAIETDIKSTVLPDNVTVIKTDYDSHQSLRQKYGVTIQTTFVKVDDSGNLIEKYVAYNEPTFESVKLNLLD